MPGGKASLCAVSNQRAKASCDDLANRNGHLRLRADSDTVDLLRTIIDLVPVGIIVVDDRQRVVRTNKCSESILRQGEFLAIQTDGRLRAVDPCARIAFAEFLCATLHPTRGNHSDEPANFLFARRKFPPVCVAAIRCLSATDATKSGNLVLLSLRNPGTDGGLSVYNFRSFYGFTPAETQIACALANGKTLAECAAERGVSVNTTKTQLNSLLAKTGLHRQLDLVRLLLAI